MNSDDYITNYIFLYYTKLNCINIIANLIKKSKLV